MIISKDSSKLINVLDVDNTLIVHMGLSFENNVTLHRKVYKNNIALLRPRTAMKLKKANDIAKSKGYCIKIYDAYRPYSITKLANELFPNLPDGLAAKTETGSWHNTGYAIDITLVDKDGNELEMPTQCQELVIEAGNQNDNSLIMQKIMIEAGFIPYDKEWWHFYDYFDDKGNKLIRGSEETPLFDFEI